MSDLNTASKLYALYARRYGDCPRTPYQADYYRKWLELLNTCSSAEEAEEKSKQNGLYTGGAAALSMDRIYAHKQAAEEMGWDDVAQFCDGIIGKIQDDPAYVFTHTGLWADLDARKNNWLRTIEGFQKLFSHFQEFDDTRSEPERAAAYFADDLKMLSKPSSDFATLAALPQFRALVDCSDEYYGEFVADVCKVIAGGSPGSLQWNTKEYGSQMEELWNKRDSILEVCRQWYAQPEKKPCVRLAPDSADGRYELIELD